MCGGGWDSWQVGVLMGRLWRSDSNGDVYFVIVTLIHNVEVSVAVQSYIYGEALATCDHDCSGDVLQHV